MRLSGMQLEKEYGREANIIHSDRFYDCIVHHTVNAVPEDDLVKAIYSCKKAEPAVPVIGPRPYIKKLADEGILHRFMLPGDDRWYYELSPVAKYTLKKLIESVGEKFDHPKLEV